MDEGPLPEGGGGDADDLDAAPGGAGLVAIAAGVVAPAGDDRDRVAGRHQVFRQVGRHLPGGGEVWGEELVEEEEVHPAAPIRRSFTRTAGTPT